MTRNNLLFGAIFLATVLCFVHCQQYVPIQILVPVNQTYPGTNNGYRPVSNYTYYNYSNTNNNGYRPPGSYLAGNQYPNYPAYSNNTFRNSSAYNGTQDGHLFAGQIQLYDRLLFNQVYRKEKRWYGTREKIIEYPSSSPAGYTRHEVISAIRVYNQFLDGNSARATIVKGGVGFQYVKIKLESNWNKGLQYLVQLYGH